MKTALSSLCITQLGVSGVMSLSCQVCPAPNYLLPCREPSSRPGDAYSSGGEHPWQCIAVQITLLPLNTGQPQAKCPVGKAARNT